MTWQHVIALQIIASSIMTIWYRKVSLEHPKRAFSISFAVYFVVAFVGICIGLAHNHFQVPQFPHGKAVLYIFAEGLIIPISWLLQYRLLTLVGASSMAVAQTINFVITALLGFIFLGDTVSGFIIIGGCMLISGVILALSINKQPAKKREVTLLTKLLILIVGSLAVGFGLLFEKLALDSIGVWSYAFYGWPMQLVGAGILFAIFGRHELLVRNPPIFWGRSLLAGFFTAIAGSLFIYSLSKGMLSSVVLASSAKIALTSVLAFWLLKERNDLRVRVLAAVLSISGLLVIFGA